MPTPKVDFKQPEFDPVAPDLSLECEAIMYELIALALETDSTRVISFLVPGQGQVFTIDGEKLSAGYHGFPIMEMIQGRLPNLIRLENSM